MHVGRILDDRYELLRPIAEGAASTVWAALDRVESREVAIKAISLDRAGWRAEVRDRLLQEARLLAMSPHEHLVRLFDMRETDDGYLFLVLELLDGQTLAHRLARQPPLSAREAATIALALARGLAALHDQGIVHRDLKPGNVILHRVDGITVPKIIDLGISKVRAAAADPQLYATLTATGQVLGTPQYMSYEQALGDRDIDARSDVWSLGVVLFEALSGRTPFEAANLNATLAAIRRLALPNLRAIARGVPEPLVAIVERCLQSDRDRRFRDGAELANELEAALVMLKDVGDAQPPRKRAPWTAVALGALAVGLVLVGLVAARPSSSAGSGAGSGELATVSSATAAAGPTTSPAPTAARVEDQPAEETTAPVAPVASAERTSKPRRAAPKASPRGRATRVDSAGF